MSSKLENAENISDDEEFKDAKSRLNEEVVEEIITSHLDNLSVKDGGETKLGNQSDSEYKQARNESPSTKEYEYSDCNCDRGSDDGNEKDEQRGEEEDDKDHYDDCAEDDFVDEEGLKEAEKDLSEEEKKENKEKAEKLKQEGNELFKNGSYAEAVELYTEALMICPVEGCSVERAFLYGNRAAAKVKLGSQQAAIEDCTKALEFHPNYMRALLRRAKLYEETEKLDECLQDYQKIYELDPSNKEAAVAVMRLPQEINERNERLKTEMMGKLKDLGNMILRPFGLSTNNFQMQQDPSTGSYSINFNQNPQ